MIQHNKIVYILSKLFYKTEAISPMQSYYYNGQSETDVVFSFLSCNKINKINFRFMKKERKDIRSLEIDLVIKKELQRLTKMR